MLYRSSHSRIFTGICCVFLVSVGALSTDSVSLLGDRERSGLLADQHTLLRFPVLRCLDCSCFGMQGWYLNFLGGAICLSPTKWTYMKKELMRRFLQRILKSGRPLLIRNSQSHDPYYFFTFGSGGVTLSTLWTSSFCSPQIMWNSPTVSPIP